MDQIWLPRPNLQPKTSNSARIKLDRNVLDIYFGKKILATFFKTVTYLLDDLFTASDMKQAMSGCSPVWTLFSTVQLIPFDISPHCSILLYSLIERCCAPAYKGGTNGDTTKLSIFFYRHHSISISESR